MWLKLFVKFKSTTLKDTEVENIQCNTKMLAGINCIVIWPWLAITLFLKLY